MNTKHSQGEALAELLRLPQCNLRTLKVLFVNLNTHYLQIYAIEKTLNS